ncbi:MAG: fold metallo-hydrolase [Actinotalea sp.]|nr:fold metallo-hydrolase [Actinotalea sp.]
MRQEHDVVHLAEVAPGVWTATARRWSSLVTVVVEPDGTCLVIDPGVSPVDVTALGRDLAARGWTPAAGVSTHPHWDHVLWSRALGDVPRWATPAGAARARLVRNDLVAQADAEGPGHEHDLTGVLEPLPPGAAAVPWSGQEVLVVGHRAHCTGSAVLVLPRSGVLVAGDLLSDLEVPLLDLTADDPVQGHLAALDLVEDLVARHAVTVLVPGHGTVAVGPEIGHRLTADRRYLEALSGLTTRDEADADGRLADPEQLAQHREQQAFVARASSGPHRQDGGSDAGG